MINLKDIKIEGLIKLGKNHIDRASEVLARSYSQDPLFCYFIQNEDEAIRNRKLFLLFRFLVKFSLRYGVGFSTPNFEGIATWLSEDKADHTLIRELQAGGLRLLFLGMDFLKKQAPIVKIIDELRKKFAPRPYCFLYTLGVEPTLQKKGYSSLLIKPMLDILERSNQNIFLETETAENVEIYKHFGFTIVDKIYLPKCNVPHWCMLIRCSKNKIHVR